MLIGIQEVQSTPVLGEKHETLPRIVLYTDLYPQVPVDWAIRQHPALTPLPKVKLHASLYNIQYDCNDALGGRKSGE